MQCLFGDRVIYCWAKPPFAGCLHHDDTAMLAGRLVSASEFNGPAMDPTTRWFSRRPCTNAIARPPEATVNFEVKNFKLYGSLKKTATEVHNTLPSLETVRVEKILLHFEETRRFAPDDANYVNFYRSLTSSIGPPRCRHHHSTASTGGNR